MSRNSIIMPPPAPEKPQMVPTTAPERMESRCRVRAEQPCTKGRGFASFAIRNLMPSPMGKRQDTMPSAVLLTE